MTMDKTGYAGGVPARSAARSQLTMGPVLFNWEPEAWRDFYYRIADEADVDSVCLGEVVCSKRAPFFAPHIPTVIQRLRAGGKEVVLSSLALIMAPREMDQMRELAAQDEFLVEANDISVVALMESRPHVIGPFVNVYNEGTLGFLALGGARWVCLPTEISVRAISALQGCTVGLNIELEVIVFGRLPLAISARCFHARSAGLHKDNCQFVCKKDNDGLEVDTLDGNAFLAINGHQTLSASYLSLAAEIPPLQALGVKRFRLTPHSMDMVKVAAVFREVTTGAIEAKEAETRIGVISGSVPICNGHFHATSGCHRKVTAAV